MTNDMQAKCFVSYCHDDVSEEEINELVERLRKASNGSVKYLFDVDNQTGSDLKQFMDQITACDSVVVVCSPSYKQKSSIVGENINYEFSLIKNKYDNFMKIKNNINEYGKISLYNFAILPIIISNAEENKISKREAYPEYFDDQKIVYKRYTFISKKTRSEIKNINILEGEKNSKRDKFLISLSKRIKDIDAENKRIINNIYCRTMTIMLQKPITQKNKDERIAKLINYTKAEINGNLGQVFCRTHFYDELIQQTKKVFVGRKGSGKSQTILQLIDEKGEDYKGVIKIDANNISIFSHMREINYPESLKSKESYINELYNDNMSFSSGFNKDIFDYFSYEQLLRYVWFGYIYLYCMYIIAADDEKGYLIECQKKNFKNAKTIIRRIIKKISNDERWNNRPEVSATLYDYSFYKAILFFESIIMESRNDDYALTCADIRASDSLKKFLIFLLTLKGFNSLNRTLKHCTRKIFVCLDGFDNIQEEQRGNKFDFNYHDNRKIITEFETIWLTSLAEVIYQINLNNTVSECQILRNHLDMCLMVPFDRFVQASYCKRDGFVYRELMSSVNYKGIELFNVFIKRLQVIADIPIKDNQNTFEEINAAQNDVFSKFPKLCKTVGITLQNKTKFCFPLFLYLLRYSFWRPRDIIDHIHYVFQTIINGEDFKTKIEEEMIIESLAISTDGIVMKTIEEFKDLWVNINESLDKISYKKIIMNYEEFETFLKENSFVVELSNENRYSDTKEIIRFLYKLGFIGLLLNNENMKSLHVKYAQHQIFYSGTRPLNNINEECFKNNKIFFNPVFHFRYNLIIDTNEILGINNWNDLKNRNAFLNEL